MSNPIKLSNVIGAPFQEYVLRQLANRAIRNSAGTTGGGLRTAEEVLFLANKTSWVRLVSSVDLAFGNEINGISVATFVERLGIEGTGIYNSNNSLAKNWILQSGTSIQNGNGIDLRQGIGPAGSYGMGGTEELGYRPMPGLTSVTIETTGRLGSLRQATVNFKVWNMNQLNVIEALYFRLGYSMLLEWGHVQYFANQDGEKVVEGGVFVRNGVYGIDNPFNENLWKDDVLRNIAIKKEQTSGNYDGMLGIVTNFTWAFNQQGGYDCTIRLVGLGSIIDSTRINQAYTIPRGIIAKYYGATSSIEEKEKLLAEASARKATRDARIAGGGGGGGVATGGQPSPAGDIPKTFGDFTKKAQTYDGSTGDTVQQYGVRDFTDILGTNNGFSFYGTYSAATGIDALAAKKAEGLYLTPRPAVPAVLDTTPLTFIPNPIATGTPSRVALYDGTLRAFASSVKDRAGNLYSSDPYTDMYPAAVGGSGDLYQITKLIARKTSQTTTTPLYVISTAPGGSGPGAPSRTVVEVLPNDPVADSDSIKVEAELRYSATGDKDVYLELGYSFKNTATSDFYLSRAELLVAIDRYFRDKSIPKLDLAVIGFKKGSFDITIEGQTTLTAQAAYKKKDGRTAADIAVTAAGAGVTLPNLREVGGKPTIDVQVILTLKTNNPGFIFGPAPAPVSTVAAPAAGAGSTPAPAVTITKPDTNQLDAAIGFSSALHAMLTVVQAISQQAVLNVTKSITLVNLLEETELFYESGVLKDVFGSPVDIRPNGNFNVTAFAQKGFASEIMTDYRNFNQVPSVDYKTLCQSIVVKYKQDNVDGIQYPGKHPVYISLGYLLAFINNMCLIYDSKKEQTTQSGNKEESRPYMYIDFNPNTNFCFTTPQQLSIDPLICLVSANMPSTGSYLQIYPEDQRSVVAKQSFNPTTANPISEFIDRAGFGFRAIKKVDGTTSQELYRGSTMNILITTQYLLQVLKDFTTSDPQHAVNLHPFLNRIMMDINKCLGGVNLFRVAYRDDTNTVQIQDDQFVPGLIEESSIMNRKDFMRLMTENTILSGQLPLFASGIPAPNDTTKWLPSLGVAREMQFKTVMSTKMASLLAISAQALTGSVNAKDHSELSYLNAYYRDRYKPYIKDQTSPGGSNTNTVPSSKKTTSSKAQNNNEQIANRLNQHIKSIYFDPQGSFNVLNVEPCKNYYIERMSKVKSGDPLTTAAPFIPAELEVTLDGIGGIVMGNAFTIPKERLPLSLRNVISPGKPDGFQKVAFIVNGLTHTIENNQWLTRLKGQMIKLREMSSLNRGVGAFAAVQAAPPPPPTGTTAVTSTSVSPIAWTGPDTNIKIAIKFFEGEGFKDYQIAAIVGALLHESGLSPTITNSIGAYGIAQWLKKRKTVLLSKPGYDTLNTQLQYIIEEFNSNEKTAGRLLRNSANIEEAIAAMAKYERFEGITGPVQGGPGGLTYEEVINTGAGRKRAQYAFGILRDYKKYT